MHRKEEGLDTGFDIQKRHISDLCQVNGKMRSGNAVLTQHAY